MTLLFDTEATESLRLDMRLSHEVIRRLRNRLLKRFLPDFAVLKDFAAIADVPESHHLKLHCLELSQRYDSQIDGATKLLFRTAAGLQIETVILRIATGRTTLCVSIQVGCAAACKFCATGHMSVVQNLTVTQILDQIVQAGQILATEQRLLHNIVFMGMGEPFHNEQNLVEAIQCLTDSRLFARSPGSLLISTVGIPESMIRCAEQFPDVNLALSLHSVDQDVRQCIIPLARKYRLPELKRAITEMNRLQKRPVMLEYLMLRGINDSPEQAQQLAAWVHDIKANINLIPFNHIDDAPDLQGSSPDVIRQFSDALKKAGLKVTTRYSLGNDIAAACGQLVRRTAKST